MGERMDVKALIKSMTLEEKASLCSGKNVWETQDIKRLGIKSVMMADGPHGLRKQKNYSDSMGVDYVYPSTCFPTAATAACSFDRRLTEKMGEAIANECIKENVDILLGPGVNIKRSPLCGRNFEYYSEDPYLSGELGAGFVKGVQRKGIGTSVKHFAGNNQEKNRQTINAVIDRRALREIYFPAFERIIKEKPYTVMASYNKINGVYSSENNELLNNILRDEWGFDGIVVTDWGACNDRVLGLKCGQDLEMPTSFGLNSALIIEAVKEGKLDERILDETVYRILELVFKCKDNEKHYDNTINGHRLARIIASESIVLLKNENNILPLNADKSIGVIGALAKYPRYQGAGSSKINPVKLDNICDILNENNIPYKYADGYDIKTDNVNSSLLREAKELAGSVDIPIIFIGLTEEYESEGFDRVHMKLPHSHNVLVEEITKINPFTVVVLSGGAPVEMPWIAKVKGLLNAYLCGESGAGAIADILLGKVNPSGKLAETYPLKLEDTPAYKSFPGGNRSVHYNESIFVGYRFYDKENKDVLFPFGYGLSYTSFTYSNLILSEEKINAGENLTVSFKVKNTGKYDGKEIVQVYVREINPKVFRPQKELKAFEKVFLYVNEEKTVHIILKDRDFAYYDPIVNKWVVNNGEYEIMVSSSSRDVKLSKTVYIDSSGYKSALPDKYNYTSEEFEKLLGTTLPPLSEKAKRPYSLNSPMYEIKRTLMGKIIVHMGLKEIKSKTKGENQAFTRIMMIKTFMDLPLRGVISYGGEKFNRKTVDAMLLMINGKYIKGLSRLISK